MKKVVFGRNVDHISVFVIITKVRNWLYIREEGAILHINIFFIEVFVCKKELWVN